MDGRTTRTTARTTAGDVAPDAALRASEARFRALVEATAQTVWTTDAAGLVVEDSPSWRAFTGQTLAEWLGEGWVAAVHPDDRAYALAQWREAAATARPVDTEFRLRHAASAHDASGGWRLTRVRAVPVRGPDDRIREWVGMNTDITDERAAAAALAASEARYRTLFESIEEGFCVVEVLFDEAGRPVDYRFLEANPAFVRQTGLADAVGRRMRELAPTHEAHWFEVYGRVARTGEPTRLEAPAEALGRHYDVSAFRVGAPDERRVAILFDDITARKQAEAERARLAAEVAAERERLRSVVLHTPAPLALLEGPEHRFALVNDAYKRVSGGGRDVTGLTPREAFPELAGSGLYERFDRVYATGEPWDGPETLVRYDRDGTGVADTWFNLRFEPVRDAAGRVTAIFNFAVDVTEQVRARRQVEGLLQAERAARAEAEAANQAKGQFLAVMSHELRTPLNAIGGYAELIELGIYGPVTDAQRAALARVQASQRHLLGLIAGVLDYSRVEAGAVTYRLADVPVTEAVAEAETLVAPQLRAKGLGYAWSGAPPGLCVRADREKLQQVLLNLLGNAVKFTHARDGAPGRLEVACTVEEGTTEEGGAGAAAGRVRLHVRDTGEGIAAEELERVFEPFVQVDQRLTRPHAGVGLGLAISRDLARGMRGDPTVESTPGVGSTFTLTLPRA